MRRTRKSPATRKSGATRKRSVTRGWKKQKPSVHERTVMLQKCGKKCFLGPNKSFPICTRRTCRVNPRGVHSAFSRARQWKYTAVAKKAKAMLQRMALRIQKRFM
jgi:hypothetical protein